MTLRNNTGQHQLMQKTYGYAVVGKGKDRMFRKDTFVGGALQDSATLGRYLGKRRVTGNVHDVYTLASEKARSMGTGGIPPKYAVISERTKGCRIVLDFHVYEPKQTEMASFQGFKGRFPE